MKKFRLLASVERSRIYLLYVKKWFRWTYLDLFSAPDEQTAIKIAKEKALAYTTPIAEFEI